MGAFWQNISEITAGILGLAFIGLLIRNSSQTVEVAQGTAGAFGQLLSVATFQNSAGVGGIYGFRR